MKKLMTILLAALLALCLTGCGAKDISGEYRLLRIDADDENVAVSEKEMDQLRELGYDITLSVSKDGTAILDIMGYEEEMTYDLKEGVLHHPDGDMALEIKGKQLLLKEEGASLVFTPVK